MKPGLVVHGGVGSPSSHKDGCEKAVQIGLKAFESGKSCLDVAVEAAIVLENDERYNAGYGAYLRLDGKTIEMDAALMTSDGSIGAVAAVQKVKNPILLAKEVWNSPHVLMVGEGAYQFAKLRGLEITDEIAPRSLEKHQKNMESIAQGKLREHPLWKNYSLEKYWNYPIPFPVETGCDTIGAVAFDGKESFAAALSTGGAGTMMLGRVGDTPLPGCGFYVGNCGAVVATGIGEFIIAKILSLQVYQAMESGKSPQEACEWGVQLYPKEVPIGLLAINRKSYGSAHNMDMAWSAGTL